MAWQDTHERITKAAVGNSYSDYHRFRDGNWQMGLAHHFTIRHSFIGDLIEATRRKDAKIVLVGFLHDITDFSPLTVIDFLKGKYRAQC